MTASPAPVVLDSFRGEPAGFVSRLGGFVVDAVVISVAASATGFAIQAVFQVLDLGTLRSGEPVPGALALGALVGTIAFVYFTAAVWLFGRTAGMLALGLRVVRLDGARPRLGQSIVRTLGYALSSILLLGYLAVAVTRQRRAWHDRISRTWVVYDWAAHPRLGAQDDGEPLEPKRLP